MLGSKIFGGNDPLVDVHAMVGGVAHADALVGGGDGNVLTVNIDHLAGTSGDVDVNAGGNGNVIDVAGFVGLGGTDADAHVTTGNGIGVDADVGLDGALINAAAGIDPSVGAHVGLDALGGCGCSDTGSAGVDVDANVSIPDIGLANPLSLSSLDLSGIDLFCGHHT
jgi:hypothetical protein